MGNQHIDAIAREKQRAVLYISFHAGSYFDESAKNFRWQEDPVREMICTRLTEHNLPWESCAEIANENLMISHREQIYLDIPYDESNPDYILACDYLEDSEGNCRFDPVAWWYLPLEVAMQNAQPTLLGINVGLTIEPLAQPTRAIALKLPQGCEVNNHYPIQLLIV